MLENEHLVSEHGQPVQVLGVLVVRDGDHRRLQPGHMGFKRDAQLVAKPALGAIADHAEEPGCGGRHAEAHGRGLREPAVVSQHSVGQALEPEREQCIR